MTENNDNGTPRPLADKVEIDTPETDRLIAVDTIHLKHLRQARYEISEGQRTRNCTQEQNAKTDLANADVVKQYLLETDRLVDPETVYSQVEAAHTRVYKPESVSWVLRNATTRGNGGPASGNGQTK